MFCLSKLVLLVQFTAAVLHSIAKLIEQVFLLTVPKRLGNFNRFLCLRPLDLSFDKAGLRIADQLATRHGEINARQSTLQCLRVETRKLIRGDAVGR